MIEQGIYFALGCIVTALLSLLFAPVFWRRALRLTRQRLALQVPLSMQEILAQRDQIRAEFAIERLCLEQALEAVQTTKATDMAAIGRHSMVAAKLGEEVAVLRQSELSQKADIDRLERELAEATTAEVASSPPADEAEDHRERPETAPADRERLHVELDSLRATVAALTTRGMGLEARLKDAERGLASKETEASLRARLETASEHIARHEAASSSMRRELDEAKTHIRKLERELELAPPAAGGMRGPSTEASSGRAPDKLELLAAENSALRGALDAVRREKGASGSSDEDAGLRETIHALGLAVAKLTRQAREGRAPSDEMPRLPVKEASVHPLGVG